MIIRFVRIIFAHYVFALRKLRSFTSFAPRGKKVIHLKIKGPWSLAVHGPTLPKDRRLDKVCYNYR